MRFITVVGALVAALVAAGSALAAPQSGLYIDLEGQWGFRVVEPYAPFVTGFYPQLSPTDEYEGWEHPNFAVVAPVSGRGEIGVVLGGGAGPYVRLGTVLSGWAGTYRYDEDSWGNVTCRAGLDGPECEINICITSLDPCDHYTAAMTRRYGEVAPRALIGFGGNIAAIAVGVQGFAGLYAEHFTSRYTQFPPSTKWSEHDDRISASIRGRLGVMEAEVMITERAKILLSGGAGRYRGFAAGIISDRGANIGTLPDDDFTSLTYPVQTSFMGFRAQLGLGFSYAINPNVSVGLMGRVDYWSRFPGLTAPTPYDPFCLVLEKGDAYCVPPEVAADHGIRVAPMVQFTLGLSLSVRIGP